MWGVWYTVDGQQITGHSRASSEVVTSPVAVAGITSRAGNSSPLGSETPPSKSAYDNISDVTEDEDGVAAAAEFLYDGLRIVSQAPPVYDQIVSDIAASATNSDAITHLDELPYYLHVIGDD